MKNLFTPTVACACFTACSGLQALTITDPGFDSDFTDIGNGFTDADSANFDKWVFEDDASSLPRRWDRLTTGGNIGGYADGAFDGNNYNRTMYQAVTDNKATTGLQDLTFDLNLSDNSTSNGPLTVSVWGVETSGSSFSLSTRAQDGVTSGNAIILGTQQLSVDTSGWEGKTISDIDFGTGYDLVIIGFWSAKYNEDHPDTVGIDNVALVPEPGSLALLGLGGLCVLRRRRA